jgi:gamma-glutamyltranspeptidase
MKGREIIRYATLLTGERLITRAQARTLRDVAERTGAKFYRGEDNRQVDAAIDEILISGRPLAGYQANPTRQDLFFYFLAAAFLCMLAGIFL